MGSNTAHITVALDRIDNDLELYQELVSIYLKEYKLQRETLRDTFRKSEVDTFERTAHSIKGASANIGAVGAQAVAYELEKLGKSGSFKGADVLLLKLDQEVAAFEAEYNVFIESGKF